MSQMGADLISKEIVWKEAIVVLSAGEKNKDSILEGFLAAFDLTAKNNILLKITVF